MLEDQYLRKLDAFSLAMREHARGGMGGLRRSKALGSSVEFSDFRAYAPGDDLRRVDWNAFARFDKLFLKLFLDEQETTLRVILDASTSMGHGTPDKWAFVLRLAATLAYLSLTRYDRVVIVTLSGDAARVSQTFSGRQAFPRAEAYLESIQPQGTTRLQTALARVPVTAGRGVCVLISDLLTEAGWTRGASSLLFRRQELSVLQVLSPQELEPDITGAVHLLDAEGEPPCDVSLSADVLRRYHQALTEFLREQASFCHSRALPYLLLSSDMDLETEVLRALMLEGVIQAR